MNKEAETEIYHVTQRAPGREKMFIEEGDYLFFLKLLKNTAQTFPVKVYAFALMPNHVHLLLKAVAEVRGKAMKFLFQSYAQGYNKKYRRKGHVVCGTYRARDCGSPEYLLNVSLYIHLNPFKAYLTKNIFDYRWTSLSCYTNPGIESFIDPAPVLELFENPDNPHQAYKTLINDIKDIRCKNVLADKSAWRRFNRDLLRLFDKLRNDYAFSPAIIKLINDNDRVDSLRGRKTGKQFKDKRGYLYCIEQMKNQGYSLTEIAENLNVSRKFIYSIIKTVTKQVTTDL